VKRNRLDPKLRQLNLLIRKEKRTEAKQAFDECFDILSEDRHFKINADSDVEEIFGEKTSERLKGLRIITIGDLISFRRDRFYEINELTWQQCRNIELILRKYNFHFQ
jgi:hypothetical protein